MITDIINIDTEVQVRELNRQVRWLWIVTIIQGIAIILIAS